MLDERLQPIVDTATEVIYQGEHCVVAYGCFLKGGMGVRFETVTGATQHGIGFRLVDVAGKLDRAAYAAATKLKEHLSDDDAAIDREIDAAADALGAWAPFSQMAVSPPLQN